MTVGEKIKKARQLNGWTQAQLASILGLPVARIQQYEANIRNPKFTQLEDFAKVLGVSTEYLTNHNLDTYNDVKHTLLELEDTFGLKISEINGNCILQFNDTELTQFLKEWQNAKKGSNSSAQTLKEYEFWKATYPLQKIDEMAEKLRTKRKELSEE